MFSKKTLRILHRWMGLIIGIQLLGWTVSGLYFTIFPIEIIRGNHLIKHQTFQPLDSHVYPIENLLSTYNANSISIKQRIDVPYYIINGNGESIYINANSGSPLVHLSEEQAIAIAEDKTGLPAIKLEIVNEDYPGAEFRGRQLPLYRITMESNENPHLYIEPITGDIVAVRTNKWRIFDALWMIHIMDYDGRENFTHILLKIFSLLGILTILSGLLLWFKTSRFMVLNEPRSADK
jgi:hypothetical protein